VIENNIYGIDNVPKEVKKDFTDVTLKFVREAYNNL
jgi:hypothetical protein